MAGSWIQVGIGRWRLVDASATAVASRADAPFVRRETLTARERRSLKIQHGRDFDSESAFRAYLKDTDQRFMEKGEPAELAARKRREWMRETKPGERGKNPAAGPMGYGGY